MVINQTVTDDLGRVVDETRAVIYSIQRLAFDIEQWCDRLHAGDCDDTTIALMLGLTRLAAALMLGQDQLTVNMAEVSRFIIGHPCND